MIDLPSETPAGRGLYANRTLNLRGIQAIGYDMDYTLVHYDVEEWERCAFSFLRAKLVERGWDVGELEFDSHFAIRGLSVDIEKGNIVKSNRFGYVKRAAHGTRFLDWDETRDAYERTVVELSNPRWSFMNTFFSLSAGCMYAQLVDLLDAGRLPDALGYSDLWSHLSQALDEAHCEGELKQAILADPERFVVLDPDTPRALLDQKEAGKALVLATNSEWEYTAPIMEFAFDRYLPGDMTWRDLFKFIIVSARKPEFFSGRHPVFAVEEDGRLLPVVGGMSPEGGVYLGGDAGLVEQALGLPGEKILYVGDHIYADVHVSKSARRWRTAVIVRELEDELKALGNFQETEVTLRDRMLDKAELEDTLARKRLEVQRLRSAGSDEASRANAEFHRLRAKLEAIDAELAPLAKQGASLWNPHWGLPMRAGNDKSHLARCVERHADIYTSRVSNFLFATPFAFVRSRRGHLPHDPE